MSFSQSVCFLSDCLCVCVCLPARWLTLFLVDCCALSSSERCSGDGFEITMLKSGTVKLVVVVATAAAVSFATVASFAVSISSRGMVV